MNENKSLVIYNGYLSVPIEEGKLYDKDLGKKINKIRHLIILLEPDIRYHEKVFLKDPYIKIYNGEKGKDSKYCCIHLVPDEKDGKHKGMYKVDHHPTGNPPRLYVNEKLMERITEILDEPSTYKGRTVWDAILYEMSIFYIGEEISYIKPDFRNNWYENE